jgi:hypothetical protein
MFLRIPSVTVDLPLSKRMTCGADLVLFFFMLYTCTTDYRHFVHMHYRLHTYMLNICQVIYVHGSPDKTTIMCHQVKP